MIKEIEAKTLLSAIHDPNAWFGVRYNMNIYRGCEHQCIYHLSSPELRTASARLPSPHGSRSPSGYHRARQLSKVRPGPKAMSTA
jgi:hypothetical protein